MRSTDDYEQLIMLLMPPGKAMPQEADAILRAIAKAMALGFSRLDNAVDDLLADIDPGGFSIGVSEIWFSLIGEQARQSGAQTTENDRESILHQLTVGETCTDILVEERFRLINGGPISIQFEPETQTIRVNTLTISDYKYFNDILPAHVAIVQDPNFG